MVVRVCNHDIYLVSRGMNAGEGQEQDHPHQPVRLILFRLDSMILSWTVHKEIGNGHQRDSRNLTHCLLVLPK